MRHATRSAILLAATLAVAASAHAAGSGWVVAKRGTTAPAGELAYVGTIVRHPKQIGVRVVVATPRAVTLSVVLSCRRGIRIRVARGRVAVQAPSTKTLRLPLSGADNCAVSATGTNPSGTLRLDLLRGA